MRKRAIDGAGSIYQDSKGNWKCALTLGYINNVRIRPVLSGKNKKDAQRKLNELIRNKDDLFEQYKIKKGSTSIKEPIKHNLHEYMDDFLQTYKGSSVSDVTIDGYENEVKRIKKFYDSNTLITDITTKNVQEFLNFLGQYLSKSTIMKTKRMFNWVFEMAVTDEIIARNPLTRFVTIPKGKKVDGFVIGGEDIETYTDKELAVMIKEFDTDEMLKPILHTLVCSGCRIQEVLALKVGSIDRTNNRILIKEAIKKVKNNEESATTKYKEVSGPTKTKCGGRWIDVSKELIDVLDIWIDTVMTEICTAGRNKGEYRFRRIREHFIKYGNEAFIFCSHRGEKRTIAGLRKIFLRRFDSVDALKGIRFKFHTFRHTKATVMVEANSKSNEDNGESRDVIKAGYVMKFLGHSNIETTLKYYASVRDKSRRTTCMDITMWYKHLKALAGVNNSEIME